MKTFRIKDKKLLIKILVIHTAALFAVALYYTILFLCNITCPIAAIIRHPCPTCGMSRAVFALFTEGITAYVYYNALAVPCLLAVWLLIHSKIFKHKKIPIAIGILVFIINMIYYICRLAMHMI